MSKQPTAIDTVKLGPERWILKLALVRPVASAAEAWPLLEDIRNDGVELVRMDDVEPVRRSYSRRTLEEIFTDQAVDLPCRTLTCRTKQDGFLSARFCRPTNASVGSVNVISVTTAPCGSSTAHSLTQIAREFLSRGAIGFGHVERRKVYLGHRGRGTINDRLDGVFWCNAFSHRYVEAIGEEIFMSAPWERVEESPGGVMTWLYDAPLDVPVDLVERRREVRRVLGEEKFVAGGWTGLPQLGCW